MNLIERRIAAVHNGGTTIEPLEFGLATGPVSCAFVQAVEAFARACPATAEARAREGAWGWARGHFTDAPETHASLTGRSAGTQSAVTLTKLRMASL